MAIFVPLLAQQVIEMIEIVVTEGDGGAGSALGAAHDAVVRQLVDEDRVLRAHDMRDRRDIGEIARDQRQHRLDAEEIGELPFELLMRRALAADETRRQGADAEGFERADRGGLDRRMSGEAEIIVIGEADEMPALGLRLMPGGCRSGQRMDRSVRDRLCRRGENA